MEQTAHWLNNEHGYHGQVALYILETKMVGDIDSESGNHTILQVVNLSVRVSGSMPLPRSTYKSWVALRECEHGYDETRQLKFVSRWIQDF